ncbi:MAG: DegT/DnrJ/EryC1/StrS family aminotransferase [Planctomycetes bacterium]|nr:DegT/DnrJ/EryC1/StrS family aminotransferase [Planctomycetota bacterium]
MITTSGLAVDGGAKAFAKMSGKAQPKVGVEEFLSIARRFGFSPEALQRLASAVSDGDLPERGPHLGRYWGSAKPSMGEQFEALAKDKFGVRHALAVSNGTGALHSTMLAIGAGPGREVICPGMGFMATSMAVALAGATPVFCDVDESLQIDPSKIEALITPRTIAVIPTHHWGVVCDMDPVMAVARKHGIKVIEDCAQSPGATYRGRFVGTIGDIGCFSISSYKIIGGGEGGMVITNDDRLFDRICQAAESGGLWRPSRCAPERYPGELFIGGNYRMSELESSINVIQLRKLAGVVDRNRAVWRRIKPQLGNYAEITWQKSNDPRGDIGYMMRYFPATDELGRKIAKALTAEGIDTSYRGAGAHPDFHVFRDMFPLFGKFADRCRAELCPVASDLYDRSLITGLDQWWSPADCDAVAAGINKVLSVYCTKIGEQA